MADPIVQTSKFLSFVLRHRPDSIGVYVDREGWAEIDELINCANKAGRHLDAELIRVVVASNDKKRFAISHDGLRIRAVQGHSNRQVSISYEERTPPEWLYHGTATRFLESIRQEGLKRGTRQYVHLSQDTETATAVGKRHGKPAVLRIEALLMHEQGYTFHQAENGVWLTLEVPRAFIL